MVDVLIVTWDGGGNIPPAFGIAAELVQRGHRVRVMGHRGVQKRAVAAGLDFVPFRAARHITSEVENPAGTIVYMCTDPGMRKDVRDELAAQPVDVVLVDCMLFGAMAGCRDAEVPYVVLEHFFDGYLTSALRGPFGWAMRARGARPGQLLKGAVSRLVASSPVLDPGYRPGSDTTVYCGPSVRGLSAAPTEPTILLSLSTYGYKGMAAVLQKVVDACRPIAAHLIVTTGPMVDPAELQVPEGSEVYAWGDHVRLMPRASLLVGHGGHSTALLALAHDLPMVVLPLSPVTDQRMVGAAIERVGAGRTLKRSSSVEQLRSAIADVLGNESFRRAAAEVGESIRSLPGPARAADVLESAAIRRGPGVPGVSR